MIYQIIAREVEAACTTKRVESGNSCWSLARSCGISDSDFYKYNGIGSNGVTENSFCGSLQVDQMVCCSSGGLPDAGAPKNPDGTCVTVAVKSGEGCWAASQRCPTPVTTPQFMSFDGNTDKVCGALAVGQLLCCGLGKLPDLSPKMNANGSCVAYKVQRDDSCSVIAGKFHITPYTKLEDFNSDTYQWIGCGNVQREQTICISPGKPPLPTINYDAQCGEASQTLVKGTYAVPSNATNAVRNATCPLRACCSRWGFCGYGEEFCAFSTTKNVAGKPVRGTGCQSGACGPQGYHSNSGPPSSFFKVGYYESWIKNRPCLNMRPSQIDTRNYTHVHYGFGLLDNSFKPYIDPKDIDVWGQFKALSGVKRILSFGGWGFSTEPATQNIITQGVMTAANRQKFISNVVSFVQDNYLDGVDMDWEYPGAWDIKGTTHTDDDGLNYLEFLKGLRAALPSKYSLSMAAPASYWYLRAFPIQDMAKLLDYIVFMTYDFRGQWDYNIKYTGPYLRSHVNWTETVDALAMITNAGVPSNKVLMGLGSYGRSFQQVDPGCSAPTCQFTANGASPGKCTATRGYLALAEIEDIIAHGQVRSKVYDALSDSIIMTYNTNDWIAYTDQAIMKNRIAKAKSMNLLGTVEWAIDLQTATTKYGVPYNPKPLADDPSAAYKECPKVDISSKSISDIVNSASDDDSSDCAIEYMAQKLRDLTKEALGKIDRMINGGPPVTKGPIDSMAFDSWLLAHLDDYFSCPGRKSARNGCSALLKWDKPDQFYKDIYNNFKIEKFQIINGTYQIPPDCSDTVPIRCTKAKEYKGNFPVIGPAKVTDSTFSKVFDDIYVPHMLTRMTDEFNTWMFKRDGNFLTPTHMDKYFKCPDGGCTIEQGDCEGKCESGNMEVRNMDDFIKAASDALKYNVTKDDFEYKDYTIHYEYCEASDIPNKPCIKRKATIVYNKYPYLLKSVVFNPVTLLGDLSKIKEISKYMDDSVSGGWEDPYVIVDTAMTVTIGLLNAAESMESIMNQAAVIISNEEAMKVQFLFDLIESFFMIGAYTIPVIGPVIGATWTILPMAIGGEKDPLAWIAASFDIIDGLASMIKLGKGFRGARDNFLKSPGKFATFKDAYKDDQRLKDIEKLESKVLKCSI
ncbi:glycosyl hydrolase [Heterostelium album PN500]|uniref:Glycosyl hydrolase n=1 Tax=Heterostelium pallidum (strain ATCC 26659 / Pp 5 / PN500) TaxID=670386 RepID=D3B6J0_HETP5|nr:glycosyl hydrolase [Heterostelium album PN500]EFA82960.1 glycosyl hydrolase [Heterostelium album PN500]|eukprot:XP_020435077.1 glycosyl hydrolase [Heterostelium album PN500]